MKKTIGSIAFACILLSATLTFAQNNVGIGTNTPNPNAALDIQSTNQGILVPRLTTVQRTAIANPTEGLMVYDTDANCFYFYESTAAAWTSLCNAGAAGPVGATGPQGPQGPAGTNGTNGTNGVDGATGATGVQGPQGPAGAAGPQGPAGTNGIDGANGAAGAQGPQGPAGSAGATGPQGPSGVLQKYHVTGTSGRLAVTSTAATLQPGLTQTFTLAAPATVVVFASIGARTTSSTSGNYATVDMVVYVNGNYLPNGGWNRFNVVNPSNSNSFNTCSINTMVSLPAGTHTIDLRTFRGAASTSPVDIGGNSSVDTNPGELTILVLN